MTGQPTLFGDPPADTRLGPRQQLILDALRDGGITDDEAGALIHAQRGRHPSDQRCDWCAQEGRTVLTALRHKGLATRRRGGQWTTPGRRPSPAAESAQQPTAGDIDWGGFGE